METNSKPESFNHGGHDVVQVSANRWEVYAEGDEHIEANCYFASTTAGACVDMIDEVISQDIDDELAALAEERETDSHNDALAIRSTFR